jgi:hypothetical protein
MQTFSFSAALTMLLTTFCMAADFTPVPSLVPMPAGLSLRHVLSLDLTLFERWAALSSYSRAART